MSSGVGPRAIVATPLCIRRGRAEAAVGAGSVEIAVLAVGHRGQGPSRRTAQPGAVRRRLLAPGPPMLAPDRSRAMTAHGRSRRDDHLRFRSCHRVSLDDTRASAVVTPRGAKCSCYRALSASVSSLARSAGAMLPPEMTTTVGPGALIRPESRAATAAAPPASQASFASR
jgi:hypothetical protein